MTARTRRSLSVALAAAFTAGIALVGVDAGAQAPPPTPPPLPAASAAPVLASPSPAAAPTPAAPATAIPTLPPTIPTGRGRRRGAPAGGASPSPTSTPTSPAFATLDGTWEVQVQYPDRTLYSYLVIRQKEGTLSGSWRNGKVETPIDGTYDGRLIRITAKQNGGDISFAGYVENASDMVGEVDFGKGKQAAFTAEHRGQAQPRGLLQKY